MTTHTQAKPVGTPTWVDLMVPDTDAARAFYHTPFGWEYDIDGPEFGGYTTARPGARTTAGIAGNQPGAPPRPAAWSLYFATDDIDADVARAESLGAKLLNPAMLIGGFGHPCRPNRRVLQLLEGGFAYRLAGYGRARRDGLARAVHLGRAGGARLLHGSARGHCRADAGWAGVLLILKHGDTQFAAIMQIDPSRGAFAPQWTTYFLLGGFPTPSGEATDGGRRIEPTRVACPLG